jgi:hypothetical protein
MADKVEVDPDLVIQASKKVHAGRDIGLDALGRLQDVFAEAIAAVGGSEKASREFLYGTDGQPGFAEGASSMTAARRSFNDGEDMTGTALNDVVAAVVGQDQDSAREFR